ncbi:MAG: class I SAM-dependent methyltransferase [Lachnospiraceae bacterium]|nr:class I SAM-dependent methyltransferase [Lachnospiraceae bacterium]
MEAYEGFGQVYDEFMDNVPYDEWCEYIVDMLNEHGVDGGLCLELGCGTGEVCERLADKGFDMIGLDASSEMLNQAIKKRDESKKDILYLLQDMTEFELYGTVKAVVSICDCLNYLIQNEQLLKTFKLVNNYLDPGGIFLFDMNTRHKYEEIGDSVIAENREDASFIWENFFDSDENINEYDLTLFVKDESGKYEKYEETHSQRAYSFDEVKNMLEDAGMEFVSCFKAFTKEEIKDEKAMNECERVYFVAREKGK